MEKRFIVQKGTIDEWEIASSIEGNLESKNLVLMVHSGGYDRDENGFYPVLENGKIKKEWKDGKNKIVLTKKPYGNYQRLSGELQAENLDCCIVRIDVRNHGASTKNGQMDERETSWERFARDLSSVIDKVEEEFGSKSIHLVGTCLGALICQYYVTGTGRNESEPMKNRGNVKSLTFISPLSTQVLSTENPKTELSKKRRKTIYEEGKKFTLMKGLFEGKETIEEAKRNADLTEKVAQLEIPTLLITSKTDRLIPFEMTKQIIDCMKKYNPNFQEVILKRSEQNGFTVKDWEEDDEVNTHGFADHCFYDPESSDICLRIETSFLKEQLEKEKELEHFYRKF